jgi:hypothetical protein
MWGCVRVVVVTNVEVSWCVLVVVVVVMLVVMMAMFGDICGDCIFVDRVFFTVNSSRGGETVGCRGLMGVKV